MYISQARFKRIRHLPLSDRRMRQVDQVFQAGRKRPFAWAAVLSAAMARWRMAEIDSSGKRGAT